MNIRSYIEALFRSTPGLELYDLTEGTNIYDLIINPLVAIFEDAIGAEDIVTAQEMRAWEYMSELPLNALKNLSRIRGVIPSEARTSSTLVKLSFSAPVNWEIPAGTTLTYGDTSFVVREAVKITEELLASNLGENNLYAYEDLYVYNEDGANIPENTLGYIADSPPELMKIEHQAVTNGIADETIYTLIEKIKDRDRRISGASPASIKTLINRYYPGVSVAVVCPGDERMERDIAYNYVYGAISPKQETGFNGKIRRDIISNPNTAYFTCMASEDLPDAPNLDAEGEINQGQYMSLIEEADATAIFATHDIMNEAFTQSSESIGSSSAVTAEALFGTRVIEVDDPSKFGIGDNINIIDTTGAVPTQSGIIESIDIGASTLTLYNNLSITVPGANMLAVVVNAEGYYVGHGWIKSEHGMPIGTCLDDSEVMVVNDEVMLGSKGSLASVNLIRQIFMKYGINNMVETLMDNMGIKIRVDGAHQYVESAIESGGQYYAQ